MKVLVAQINPTVGNFKGNCEKIVKAIEEGKKKGATIIVFPELALTGYPPEDLLLLPNFIEEAEDVLEKIAKHTKGVTVLLGTVRKNLTRAEKNLCNSCAILSEGKIVGFQDKSLLPDYDVFSERRYFEPSTEIKVWDLFGKKVAITICEDIWQHAGLVGYSDYPHDPILELKKLAPELVINISSSPYYIGRTPVRLSVGSAVVKTLKCPFLLCNQVGGNDSLIFDGYSYFLDAEGHLKALARGFEEDLLEIDLEEKYPTLKITPDPVRDLHSALVLGVKDYFGKLGFKKACLGLSGGIDSALVAEIAVQALGKENVLCLSMPSRYTSKQSQHDAAKLATNLGIDFKEISIEKPFESFLGELKAPFVGKKEDMTEENLQSRIRGTYLMAFSNKFGYLVLCTGNKSEMAMGYTTLYGDTCGALSVLGDVTKNQIYALCRWINREKEIIPRSILEREPTAELRLNQKDSDTLPPYPLLDRVLEEYVEEHLSPEEIAERLQQPLPDILSLIKRIHLNEYKRRQCPPPLRVTKKAFTVGRRFPIVQHWNV